MIVVFYIIGFCFALSSLILVIVGSYILVNKKKRIVVEPFEIVSEPDLLSETIKDPDYREAVEQLNAEFRHGKVPTPWKSEDDTPST